MESHQNLTPVASHHVDTSRPSLGFPLGTALLLIIIFSLSGFFSCCYHWEKIRSLRRRGGSHNSDDTDLEADHQDIQSTTKAKPMLLDSKVNQNESMPVVMPGDQMPKFIALPCPCKPPRLEKTMVEVQASPSIPPGPLPLPLPSPRPTIVYSHVAQFPVYYEG